MVRPYLVNEWATLRKSDKVIRIANWWWNNSIYISWQKAFFTGSPNDPAGLRGRAGIANEHLHPVEHERLRAEESCARRIENVRGHVIAIRPNAQFGIIKEVAGQVKVVPIPGTSSIAGLGDSDTLVLGNRRAARHGELANNPSVGELIICDYRITAATILARPAETGPN